MSIIFTPFDFPKNIKFSILNADEKISFWDSIRYKFKKKTPKRTFNDEVAEKLQNILKKYCPTSACIRIQNDIMKNKNEYKLVVFQPDVHTLHKALIKAGWKDENIILMPLPIFDFWAYWNLDFRIFTNEDGSVNVEKSMNSTEFLQDILDRKMSITDGNELKPIYPHKSGLKWREELGVEGGCATHFYPYPSLDPQVQKNLDRIDSIRNSLSDEKSKEIYTKVLLGKPYDVMEHYFNNTPKRLQYFEYLNIRPGDNIINCGVDSGFEIPFFCTLMEGKGNVYNIDPDGFDRLQPYSKEFADKHKSMLHQTRYYIGGKVGDKYVDKKDFSFTDHYRDGSEKVSLITVDHFVKENNLDRVDVIKMDVEGGELPATPEMIKTIRRFRPQLAIAVYHGANHFWEIPEMLIKNCENYNFYFNIYSYAHFEGIFYAIPKERDISRSQA